MDTDPYDKSYIKALGKAILIDIILIILVATSFTLYNLIFKSNIIAPIEIIKNQIFLTVNLVILLFLTIEFIKKEKELI